MTPKAIEAIRKEAFVQGWLDGYARSTNTDLAVLTDEQLLAILPIVEGAYVAFKASRSS